MKLAEKHTRVVRLDDELRQLQRTLQQLDKGSVLYFRAGMTNQKLAEGFAKITEGIAKRGFPLVPSFVIHYPKLSVGQWMKNWNEKYKTFVEKPDLYKKIQPIFEEIKTHRPYITQAGVSKKVVIPDAKFYEVSDFTSQMLRDYLEIISKTKSLDVNSLLPKGEDMKISDGGEQRTVPVSTIKELLFTSPRGGSLRSNPYMSLILTEIEGVNWFSQLMSLTRGLEILDRGKMKALMMDDIGEGFDLELEESPIFGLPLHKDDDNTPKTKEKFKAFMSKKIDIFDTAEMVNEDIEGTISLKMKTSLDDAIEEIGLLD